MERFIPFIIFCFVLNPYAAKSMKSVFGCQTADLRALPDCQIIDPVNMRNDMLNNLGLAAIPMHDAFLHNKTGLDPDAYRNVSQLITSRGYPLEEHIVLTKDGYLLSVQRIPYGKHNNTHRCNKEVVLLFHGEAGDGKTWFLNPPGQSLGYILPEAGCDVWILNSRGSTYSRKNIYYPTRSYDFWNFTFDDIAKYDATATIDYVLKATGKKSLNIIGYSRGTIVSFVLLSELPEYNKKVKLLITLAPAAFFGHITSVLRCFAPFSEEVTIGINAVTQGEFLLTSKFGRIITDKFCEAQDVQLCRRFIYAIAGPDKRNLNTSRVPFYSAQYPSSTSIKILSHYAQLIRSKKFRKYDYGPLLNMKYYNQATPPNYLLFRITSPVALFSAKNDIIADTRDVRILRRKLNSTCVMDYRTGRSFNHLDFIWGMKAPKCIYEPVIELLETFSNSKSIDKCKKNKQI